MEDHGGGSQEASDAQADSLVRLQEAEKHYEPETGEGAGSSGSGCCGVGGQAPDLANAGLNRCFDASV